MHHDICCICQILQDFFWWLCKLVLLIQTWTVYTFSKERHPRILFPAFLHTLRVRRACAVVGLWKRSHSIKLRVCVLLSCATNQLLPDFIPRVRLILRMLLIQALNKNLQMCNSKYERCRRVPHELHWDIIPLTHTYKHIHLTNKWMFIEDAEGPAFPSGKVSCLP